MAFAGLGALGVAGCIDDTSADVPGEMNPTDDNPALTGTDEPGTTPRSASMKTRSPQSATTAKRSGSAPRNARGSLLATPGGVHLLGALAAHLVGDEAGEVAEFDDARFPVVLGGRRDLAGAGGPLVDEGGHAGAVPVEFEHHGVGVARATDQAVVARSVQRGATAPTLHVGPDNRFASINGTVRGARPEVA